MGLQDLLPTLASLAGLTLDRQIDGLDLAPLLEGTVSDVREYFFASCFDEPRQLFMVADKKHKYMYSQNAGVEEFYDLERDPDKRENLVRKSEIQGELKRMRDMLVRWLSENGDTSALENGRLRKTDSDVVAEAHFEAGTMGWRWY